MRRPLQRARILRRTDDRPPLTLPSAVRRILKKYGAALLMPGAAVPILGPELVVNGGFDSDAGWPAAANVVISGGVANATGVAANSTIVTQDIAGVANKVLEVSALVTVQAGGAILRPGGVNGVAITASGFYKQTISSGSFDTFRAISTASGFTGSIDNVSVREILGYQNTYSSFAAGNYRESTGQNPAGVDQQVGLVVDAAQSLGPEIATGNNLAGFSNITAEVSHTNSAFTTTGPTVGVAIPVTAGKYYEVVVAGSTTSEEFSVNTYSPVGPARTLARVGFGRCVIKADFPNIYLRNSTAGVTQITHISVRELPGILALQATSGFQPYLRQSPKAFGSERVIGNWSTPNGYDNASVGNGQSVTVTAGTAVGARAAIALQPLEVGKTYRVTARCMSQTATTGFYVREGSVPGNGTTTLSSPGLAAGGYYEATFTATRPDYNVLTSANVAASYAFSDVSVREVVEWSYAWQFDAGDDRMALSAVPFEMADDFFGVFGYRIAAAADVNLLALRNTGQTNPAIVFGLLPNGSPRFWARNDAGTFVQTQGIPRIGIDTVLTGRKYSATMECRVDGTLVQSAARPANALTVNNATLCASVATTAGGFFNGNLHGVILGKGAITDAELLTLEKFIARLQGRNL